MPTIQDNKEYFSEVSLENIQFPGTDENVVLHTKTRRYLVGLLGMVSTTLLYYNSIIVIRREDFSSDEEYKQRVLEDFEDSINVFDTAGINTDFDADTF
mgnify:CR=1 FL=1